MMVATFFNHYSAMLFKKKFGAGCRLRPVPRTLSSSCGTCAEFFYDGELEGLMSFFDENLEGLYEEDGAKYRKIYGD